MMTADLQSECPNQDQWRDFLLGQASDRQVETFGDHLAKCATCESEVEEMRPQIEKMFEQIRAGAKHSNTEFDQFFGESQCDKLIEIASSLYLEMTDPVGEGDTTVTLEQKEREEARRKAAREAETREQELEPTELPKKIGKYEILELAGEGSFGRVYKAYDPMLDKHVAIKVPKKDMIAGRPAQQVFLDEARAAATFDHQNIVRIFGTDYFDDDQVYIVMEWIDGETLQARLSRGKLEQDEALRVAIEIAKALEVVHARGITHRDLKPGNIFMDSHGDVKVADFGLSLHESKLGEHRGEFAGTVSYMAPEQIRERVDNSDGRVDIWALGVILYECLTGERPFTGDAEERKRQILERDPRPPSQWNSNLRQKIDTIVLQCLEKEADKRPASCTRLMHQLQEIEPDEMPKEKRTLITVTMSLVAVATLAIVAWFFIPPKDPRPQVGIWFDMFTNQPESLCEDWNQIYDPGNRDNGYFDEDKKRHFVRAVHPDLYSYIRCDSKNFELELDFVADQNYSGRFGIFYDLKKKTADDLTLFFAKAIEIKTKDPQSLKLEKSNYSFRHSRSNAKPPITGKQVTEPGPVVKFDPGSRVIRIELLVRERKLVNVRINGKNIVFQTTPYPPLTKLDAPSTGDIGVFVTGGASVEFSNPRLRLEKEAE